jgi:hypothetical protein
VAGCAVLAEEAGRGRGGSEVINCNPTFRIRRLIDAVISAVIRLVLF